MSEQRGNVETKEEQETEAIDNKMIYIATLKGEYNKDKWRLEASCRGFGPTDFFVEKRGGARAYFEARCVCYGCPVKQECLDFALENSIKDGMWGGLTYRERLKYMKGKRNFPISIFDLVKGLRGPNQTIKVLAERLGVSEDQVRSEIRKGKK